MCVCVCVCACVCESVVCPGAVYVVDLLFMFGSLLEEHDYG